MRFNAIFSATSMPRTPILVKKHYSFTFTKFTLLSSLLALGACNTGIKDLPTIEDIETPITWSADTQPQLQVKKTDQKNDSVKPTKEVENGWLKKFKDPDLEQYAQKALQKNPDLLGSAARLKSAIKQVNITGSNLWPSVSANLNQNRTTVKGQTLSGTNPINDTDGIDDDLSGVNLDGIDAADIEEQTSSVTTQIRTVRATLNISWEADVWGKLSQRKKASAYTAKAQAELFKYAELSLVANVSRAWYNLTANKLQLDLAHQRLDSFKNTASLIEENYKGGISSALDVYLSRSDVQQQIASLSDARFNYIQTLRAFKTLIGEYPDTNLEFTAKLPELTESPSIGLPAQLLTRRPDIKASQLSYQAEIASAKAAQRDLYPSINFTGSIGDSRDSFNQLFDGENLIRQFISDLTLPIFASGSLRSLRDQALHSAESAYANLLSTTLTAFEEVENSLSQEALLREQKNAIKEAVQLAENGLELALDRYKLGIENYNTVLESQRRVFDSKQNEINIRNALLQNRIGLHLALGGDFSDDVDRILPTVSKAK